jgi:MFS family permease
MSRTSERRGISRVNVVIVGAFALSTVVLLVAGAADRAISMGVLTVMVLIQALVAAQPGVSDSTRVNGLEYRDERDRQLAQRGFAAVGVAALLVSCGTFLVGTLTGDVDWWTAGQMLVLVVVWGVANRIAVRRS